MERKSQTRLVLLAVLCAVPSLVEGAAVVWGQAHGMTGKALRDGLDFWAGGFLALHGHVAMLFDQTAYDGFLRGIYGKLPVHLWSYPPNYLLLAAGFDWLPPWPAVLAFDALGLAALAAVLRLAGLPGLFVLVVVLSPASLENLRGGADGVDWGWTFGPAEAAAFGWSADWVGEHQAAIGAGFAVVFVAQVAGSVWVCGGGGDPVGGSVLAGVWGGGLGGVLGGDAAGDGCGAADRPAAGICRRVDQRVCRRTRVGGACGVGGSGVGDGGGGFAGRNAS
jgi:hypothetical protein